MEEEIRNNSELMLDILGWDVNNWAPTLDYWQKILNKKTGGRALEIGTGRGGLSLFVAINGLDVLCSDLDNPKNRASALHNKYQHKNNITYEAINALDIPYENCFDIVIFKSVIGGITRSGQDARQKVVIEQIYKSLKPGGYLLFAENLISSPFHRFFRKYFVQWGKEWNYGTAYKLKESMNMFSDVIYWTTGFAGAFGRTEFQRSILSRVDNILINKVVPKSWNYIMYGSAKKALVGI
jgi:SAM-dependent methyltransferase